MIDLPQQYPALWAMHGGGDVAAPAESPSLPWEAIMADVLAGPDQQSLADLRGLLEAHPMRLRLDAAGQVEVVADAVWRAANRQAYALAIMIVYDLASAAVAKHVAPLLDKRNKFQIVGPAGPLQNSGRVANGRPESRKLFEDKWGWKNGTGQ